MMEKLNTKEIKKLLAKDKKVEWISKEQIKFVLKTYEDTHRWTDFIVGLEEAGFSQFQIGFSVMFVKALPAINLMNIMEAMTTEEGDVKIEK